MRQIPQIIQMIPTIFVIKNGAMRRKIPATNSNIELFMFFILSKAGDMVEVFL